MRSNTRRVFSQLSICGLKDYQYKFSQLASVRQPERQHAPGDAGAEGITASSNIFYYLFEDHAAAVDVLIDSKSALDTIVRCLPFHIVLACWPSPC